MGGQCRTPHIHLAFLKREIKRDDNNRNRPERMMWRAGTQWQAGENTVQEILSKEVLAALDVDPNFTVSAGGNEKTKAGWRKARVKPKRKPLPEEKGIAAKPAAKPTPEQGAASAQPARASSQANA